MAKNRHRIQNMAKGILMAAALLISCMGQMLLPADVQAATPTNHVPITCYPIKNARYKTWASVNGGSAGYIDGGDRCTILETYENGWCKVKYPIPGNRTKTAYSWMEFFFSNTQFSPSEVLAGNRMKVFPRSDCQGDLGTVYSDDKVIVTGKDGNATQILYPVSGGYKLGWVSGTVGGTAQNSRPVSDGMYKIISALNSKYVLDISGASTANNGNLQLHQDNGTNAQKFTFKYCSDGYYTITNVNSGKVLDCAGAGTRNGTNVCQYASNNSSAQRWKLTPAGNGYYTLTCKCNGKVIDIAGGIVANGRNAQIYQSNGSAAQKFKLEATTKSTAPSSSGSNSAFSPVWPCQNTYTISCLYRRSDGTKHSTRFKYGIDIAAPKGEKVLAVESGTVIRSEYSTTSGFGNWIMIQHNNGKVSLYAHLSQRDVSKGNTVTKGQVIGRVGNTSAKYNIGYHLHFELGNSNTSGAAGDPYQEYYKGRYPLVIKCSTNK